MCVCVWRFDEIPLHPHFDPLTYRVYKTSARGSRVMK